MGAPTHSLPHSVHYTAVDAHQHDYRFRVLVGGSSKKAHDDALDAMKYLQRDAWVTADDAIEYAEVRMELAAKDTEV